MPSVDDALVWKGAWASGETYAEGDQVYVGTTVYVCTDDHTADANNGPPGADFWELAAPASVGAAYASVTEYRNQISNSNDADDTTIAVQLISATRVFERETKQFFGKDPSPVARIFKAKYYDRLDLDYEGNCPGIATTSGLQIQVDTTGRGDFGTAWATTDYDLWPMQADKGPEPEPWTTILRKRTGAQSFKVGNDVKVTAVYGWPSVPQAAKDEVILLCAIWRREAPKSAVDELGLSITEQSLLRRWRDAYRSKRVTF